MTLRPSLPILILAAAAFPGLADNHAAADLGRELLSAGLDPAECYHVRDVEISQEDAQFYLTDGYLIFGKPVNGAPVAAVFSADTDGGDAEVLLFPPNRAERKSLASYTGSPNLDEHFVNAVFLFTDRGARSVLERIRSREGTRKSPEIGAVLADGWTPILNNLMTSFESRMVLDLLNGESLEPGSFQAIIQGRKLGNFDIGYDPRTYEQLTAGQIVTRSGRTYWDTWTSFTSRSHRGQPASESEERILSYRIEATLDPALVLHCVTRIKITTTPGSRSVIPFDLTGQMHATEAMVDGLPAEVYERNSVRNGLAMNNGNELLLVIPPQPLAVGSEHEIEIHHEGRVISDTGNQVYFVGSRGAWYPSRGSQFATYDVTYRYPKTLDLVSTGQVTDDRTEGDFRITRHTPNGRVRMLAFNLGLYEHKLIERGGIGVEVSANRQIEERLRPPRPVDTVPIEPAPIIRSMRLPRGSLQAPLIPPVNMPSPPEATPADAVSQIADEVAAAVEFYRARFGEPPVNRIEISPVPGRFGQGFAGMIYLSTLSYLPATAHPLASLPPYERLFYGELLRAHEAAHQWWGNVVTAGSYHTEWLMEALANYSALMFLENRKGSKFLDTALEEYRRELLAKGVNGDEAESEGPVVQGRRLENSNNPNAWVAVAYGKGTWILHMLRRRMGDAQFTKMLAELRRRYEWKTIDTEQFRALCSQFLPAGDPDARLENFFDQWVYSTGVPNLKLNYTVKGKPGAYKLTGTLTQSDAPDDFTVAVPVEVQTGHGKVIRQVRTGSEPVAFSIPVTIPSAKAILDPGSSVLRR
jgi:hypothetical protein